MANIQFGGGYAAFNPSSVNAAQLANPTPLSPALVQETSVDFKADNKSLFGRNQFAVDVARGQIKANGKGKIGSTDPMFLNQMYFGMPQTVGSIRPVPNEQHNFAPSIQVTQHAGFAKDMGVTNATSGLAMIRVATNPAIGQYSVDLGAGNYSFNAAEPATAVQISYSYSDLTSGVTIGISAQINGYSPEFELEMSNYYRGKLFALVLYRCKMTDISLASKQTDYWMSDFSFEICANDAGNVGTIYADQ